MSHLLGQARAGYGWTVVVGLAHQHGDTKARWFARDRRAAFFLPIVIRTSGQLTGPIPATTIDDHIHSPAHQRPTGGFAMEEWSPLEEDVLLKGSLLVIVRGRDGRPRPDKRVMVKGCGFV